MWPVLNIYFFKNEWGNCLFSISANHLLNVYYFLSAKDNFNVIKHVHPEPYKF